MLRYVASFLLLHSFLSLGELDVCIKRDGNDTLLLIFE